VRNPFDALTSDLLRFAATGAHLPPPAYASPFNRREAIDAYRKRRQSNDAWVRRTACDGDGDVGVKDALARP